MVVGGLAGRVGGVSERGWEGGKKKACYRVSESPNNYRFRHQYRIGHGVAFLIHSVRSRRNTESSESARPDEYDVQEKETIIRITDKKKKKTMRDAPRLFSPNNATSLL